jgi:hypothetical protein
MALKAAGKRTTSADGTVRVHGKASNGEGSIYRDAGGAWRATDTVADVVEELRARRRAQAIERLSIGEHWPTRTYEGQCVSLVFTTLTAA